MGCMNSKPVGPADKEAIAQNAKIDKMIKNDKKTMDRTIKILLLGTQSRRTLFFLRGKHTTAHGRNAEGFG